MTNEPLEGKSCFHCSAPIQGKGMAFNIGNKDVAISIMFDSSCYQIYAKKINRTVVQNG